MIVKVNVDGPHVEVLEPDVLNKFHVASDGDTAATVAALGDAGRAADKIDHIWVRIDAVRALVAGQVDEGWGQRFDEMIAFAGQHGWVDEAGTHVMAHVEPRS